MNAKNLILSETERLKTALSEAKADVKIVFSHVTGLDAVIAMLSEKEIDDSAAQDIHAKVTRLINGEPIQYVLGKWSFMGNEFIVTNDVLIPRADTEILAELAITTIKNSRNCKKVLDLCTGSGCIGVSIARECICCNVDCADISDKALNIAEQNIKLNRVEKNAVIIKSDMLSACGVYDIIVSNPPYIPTKTVAELDEKVRCNEPHTALDGGDDGLDFYRIIAENARKHLGKNGKLMVEIGYDQKNAVTEIFYKQGFFNITCMKDYSGNDRVISCDVNGVE